MNAGRNLFPVVSHLIIIIIILSILSLVSVAQVLENCDNSYGNYTKGSRYETNLNNLLSSLHSNIDPFGFANSTSSSGEGDSDDPAYALFLCRGDIDHDSCTKCVNDSVSKLTTTCPGYKQASGTYDGCMLRYSNRSLTGSVAANLFLFAWNTANATNVAQFNQELGTLMTDLRTKASKGGSLLKFAAGNKTTIPDFQTLYGLVQCTPDLTEQQCNNCLLDRIAQIPDCCDGKRGGLVIAWSCYLRFETYLFYNDTRVLELLSPPPPSPGSPPPIPSPPPPDLSAPGNNNTNQSTVRRIVAISIPTVLGFILIIFLCFIIISRRSKKHKKKKKKKKKKKSSIPAKPIERLDSSMNDISSTEIVQYDFNKIKEATNDFSNDNRLGEGGFGVVYKGEFSNGQEIAVKRLSREHGQGEQEFKNEVLLVAKLQHRNLVRILGFCIDGTERLLVYEFLANSSLDHFLFDHVKRTQLDWQRRYKIIGGTARGLLYLHEDSRVRIIHRDMKASNILLDAEMNPKISDFGMARLSVMDETQGNTSKVVGTYGYMAPEYIMHGQFSVKSDVYSFGILVLEIISGQKNNNAFNNGEDILSFAWKCWRERRAPDMIDPILKDGGGSIREMIRCIHIGLLCTQDIASERPTMASVVLMFNSFSLTLPVPSEPTFLLSRSRDTNDMIPFHENDNSRVSEESGQIRSSDGTKTKSEQFSTCSDSITEVYPR
ncbi:cysteine-rich receptor-like protein kinase 25 [Impatiens glandulifera]|uniref:cysteine-rich receptor-like protein kinase 25 n=1 Tax=Impatiens glandulifera TaxID=253017 RepID=UPI001FB094D8|nr:cysteine-rich receptor-like protein kinase 25 [Impatiens glandulifera]